MRRGKFIASGRGANIESRASLLTEHGVNDDERGHAHDDRHGAGVVTTTCGEDAVLTGVRVRSLFLRSGPCLPRCVGW